MGSKLALLILREAQRKEKTEDKQSNCDEKTQADEAWHRPGEFSGIRGMPHQPLKIADCN